MPGVGGTAAATPSTNTLRSFGGLAPALPAQGAINTISGILGVATSATPLGAASFAIGTIANIFGAHHQASLKKEGDSLNGAVPAFAQSLQTIIAAVNNGQLDSSSAQSYVDQAVSAYDSAVSGITNNPGASADSAKCNAACYIRVHWILPWAQLAKGILQSGGTANFPAIPSHATQQGYPGFSLTVNGQALRPGQNTSPISTGLANNGQTSIGLGGVGTTVGNGVVVPYSSQSGASPNALVAPGAAGAYLGANMAAGTLFGIPTGTLLIVGILIAGVVVIAGIAKESRR
jgi:hypothetical protein